MPYKLRECIGQNIDIWNSRMCSFNDPASR